MKKNNFTIFIIMVLVIFLFTYISSNQKLSGELSSRTLPTTMYTDRIYNISITVTPGTSTYYLVDEVIPSDWFVTWASDSGDYSTTSGHIFWTVMSNAVTKTYIYTVNTGASTGNKNFSGTIGFESFAPAAIGGTTTATVTTCTATCSNNANVCQGQTYADQLCGTTCTGTATPQIDALNSIGLWKASPSTSSMTYALDKISRWKQLAC